MPLEDLTGPDKFIDALVPANPTGPDPKSEGDDHIRGVKNVLQNTFPNITGAVTKTQDELNAPGVPTGAMMQWPVATPPPDWLICDGSLQLVATYPDLAAVLGTAYGGDGVTEFGLPDMRGHAAVGVDTGTFSPIGSVTGAESHQLSLAELPAHSHSATVNMQGGSTVNSNLGGPIDGGGNLSYNTPPTVSIGNAGSNGFHNNIQPSRALHFIIRT